ncbi:hypothetical protein Dfri01_69380 [Dyadobacter frigoris]|nr:hypothetical protein [Dyadobacter frigoris]GLU57477.1 hypothetical protein Dfri01_69380 [Dyadobacter frigoris]
MEIQKKTRERRSYEPDFKSEILQLPVSGKSVEGVSQNIFFIVGKWYKK